MQTKFANSINAQKNAQFPTRFELKYGYSHFSTSVLRKSSKLTVFFGTPYCSNLCYKILKLVLQNSQIFLTKFSKSAAKLVKINDIRKYF